MENGSTESVSFVELHAFQLKSSGIPEALWNALGQKLENDVRKQDQETFIMLHVIIFMNLI